MRLLPDSVEKKGWAIALAVAAGLGLVAEDAFADRSRHNSSSARQHRPSQQPRHHVQPRHYVQPRHHHSHVPRIVVVPSFAPRHYYVPAPVYVAPPVIVAPLVAPSTSSGYWYFCPDSRTYYPYVLECASGWLAVVPGAAGPPLTDENRNGQD